MGPSTGVTLYTLVAALPLPVAADHVGDEDSDDQSGQSHANRDRDDVVRLVVAVHGGLEGKK